MKLNLFTGSQSILLVILPFTVCFAQVYTPFYLQDSKWVITRTYPVLGPGDGHDYWEDYTLADTVISDTTYTILARRNLCRLFPDMSGVLHNDANLDTHERLVGGLREENKKVYIRYFTSPIERLLYDFDVAVDDTVYFTPTVFTIIRSVNPPQNGLISYTVTNSTAFAYPYETGTLFEGIGSSYGLFGSYDSYLTDLLCFARDAEGDSLAMACTPCSQFITSNKDDQIRPGSLSVKVYPLPTRGMLTVESGIEINLLKITVLDITGHVLLQIPCSTNQVELDLSLLPASILILVIQYNNGAQVVKRVVKL